MRNVATESSLLSAPQSSSISSHEASVFVGRTCKLLDDDMQDAWLEVCAPEFNYRIVAHSEELGMDMNWLDHTRDELLTLFKNIPSHVRTAGKFFRHPGMSIPNDAERDCFETPVAIYHTTLRGQTSLYAACRYVDRLCIQGNAIRLFERVVRMDTRVLDFGSHMIL